LAQAYIGVLTLQKTMFSRSASIVTFFAALLLMIAPATSQSFFGYPHARANAFDDFYGSDLRGWSLGAHRYNEGYDDRYYDDYFGHRYQAPCPRYQPMQLSNWQLAADGQLALQVSLPGVSQRDSVAQLNRDASAIQIQALRALPSRGRACLPAEAKVSANGRYEILEAAIPVPAIGNAQEASVRQIRGGLRISMPRKPQHQSSVPGVEGSSSRIDINAQSKSRHPAGDQRRQEEGKGMSTGGGHTKTHAAASIAQTRTSPRPSSMVSPVSHIPPAPTHTQQVLRPSVILPPSTGIEVEDAEFPWPAKNPDASEGWVDNRGEFQAY